MKFFIVALICTVLIANINRVSSEIILTSCARMNDGALGAKVARGACITSCKFQNCGTGYCQMRGGRPVCVCSRCGGGGGEWPNIPGRGKREVTE